MDKEQLAPWIEKLNQAEKKDRNAVVTELCKAEGLSIGEAWRLLKEAGFDPKAAPGDQNPPGTDTAPAEEKKVSVVVRHKTGYPKYRRAGLSLSQKAETHEVTEAQLDALKKDPWVEIIEK
jgi:transposase